jgi:hypothetical protein
VRPYRYFADLRLAWALAGSIQSYPQIAQITPNCLVVRNLLMALNVDIAGFIVTDRQRLTRCARRL